ncbi:MAG: hypothetical protein GEU94_09440 [Micromonosporaceae bacterium]|nr:hypothetical protein [Micromonosporaceae bacterium]
MRTIIVRLFEPAPDAGEVDLHGFVEDVESGARRRFIQGSQLLEAIEEIAEKRAAEGAAGRD